MLLEYEGVPLRCFRFAAFAFGAVLLAIPAILGTPMIAQGIPTASRGFVPSAFGAITGTYTGLNGGRNLGITAGIDIGFKPFRGFLPSIEGRGTYPIDNGEVAGEEHVEGGVRLQRRYGPLRPYADFLFGRGELNYQNGGLAVPMQAFRYLQTTTNVISPGLGVEIDATTHFALLVDGQFQIWGVPFDPSGKTSGSGHIFSFPGTIGVVYRFGWLQHGHPAAR